jgi:hypothetical protein
MLLLDCKGLKVMINVGFFFLSIWNKNKNDILFVLIIGVTATSQYKKYAVYFIGDICDEWLFFSIVKAKWA